MVASAVQIAKRTLLATMRAVALSFGMVLTCNRDSSDKDVVVNFRKLALRVHPDRPGGSTAQQGRLNDARVAWEDVMGSAKKAGRPKDNHQDKRKRCAEAGADGIFKQVVVLASKSGKEYPHVPHSPGNRLARLGCPQQLWEASSFVSSGASLGRNLIWRLQRHRFPPHQEDPG